MTVPHHIVANVVSEQIVYSGYVSVIRRNVQFTNSGRDMTDNGHGKDDQCCVDFDVAGHPSAAFKCAVVLPFHACTREVTVVREYAQGAGRYMYALPSGNFDPSQHANIRDTAVFELEEEAQLTGGCWYALLPPDHRGIPEVKWCANAFTPFLCVDPVPHPDAKVRDFVEIVSGQTVERMSFERFQHEIRHGTFLLPSIATGYMAIAKINELAL